MLTGSLQIGAYAYIWAHDRQKLIITGLSFSFIHIFDFKRCAMVSSFYSLVTLCCEIQFSLVETYCMFKKKIRTFFLWVFMRFNSISPFTSKQKLWVMIDPQDTHWIPSVLSLSSTPMSQIKLAYKVPFMLHWTTSFLTNTNMKMLC